MSYVTRLTMLLLGANWAAEANVLSSEKRFAFEDLEPFHSVGTAHIFVSRTFLNFRKRRDPEELYRSSSSFLLEPQSNSNQSRPSQTEPYKLKMFEQFQAQQKKAKDEERKKKTEAAAALQGYRKTDLSGEELKLAALREEERQRKAEAAAALQQYRKAGLSEEEAKLAAAKQEELRKKQCLEEQLRNGGVVTAHDPSVHSSLAEMENSGAVSAMAAQFGIDNKTVNTTNAGNRTAVAAVPPSPVQEDNKNVARGVESRIDFVFGLITASGDVPVTDGYLTRADQITKNVLRQQSTTAISSVSYPKVKSITKDDGTDTELGVAVGVCVCVVC